MFVEFPNEIYKEIFLHCIQETSFQIRSTCRLFCQILQSNEELFQLHLKNIKDPSYWLQHNFSHLHRTFSILFPCTQLKINEYMLLITLGAEKFLTRHISNSENKYKIMKFLSLACVLQQIKQQKQFDNIFKHLSSIVATQIPNYNKILELLPKMLTTQCDSKFDADDYFDLFHTHCVYLVDSFLFLENHIAHREKILMKDYKLNVLKNIHHLYAFSSLWRIFDHHIIPKDVDVFDFVFQNIRSISILFFNPDDAIVRKWLIDTNNFEALFPSFNDHAESLWTWPILYLDEEFFLWFVKNFVGSGGALRSHFFYWEMVMKSKSDRVVQFCFQNFLIHDKPLTGTINTTLALDLWTKHGGTIDWSSIRSDSVKVYQYIQERGLLSKDHHLTCCVEFLFTDENLVHNLKTRFTSDIVLLLYLEEMRNCELQQFDKFEQKAKSVISSFLELYPKTEMTQIAIWSLTFNVFAVSVLLKIHGYDFKTLKTHQTQNLNRCSQLWIQNCNKI